MIQIEDKFINSLHRPANTRLKSCVHVCNFIKKVVFPPNLFRVYFFIYILKELNDTYAHNLTADNYGITGEESVIKLNSFFEKMSSENKIQYLKDFNLAKKNKIEIEQKIFSLMKTIGYYKTLATTFGLINGHKLTTLGYDLVSMSSKKDFTKLSEKEKHFFFERIIEKDLLFILPLIFWKTIISKYPDIVMGTGEKNKYSEELTIFISDALVNNKFLYTLKSWDNYIAVRNQWLKDINCIGNKGNIKPSFRKELILLSNETDYYTKIEFLTKEYIRNKAKPKILYTLNLKIVNLAYKKLVKEQERENYTFINLYDIAQEVQFSYKKMQDFLLQLVKDKATWQKIHLNNIIGAADSRKRFLVGKKAVLNIKIMKDIG